MNKEKYLERLKELKDYTDIEVAHLEADNILCELLESLGYEDILDAYGDVPKWYS